jgi:negative regulator of sigma E activity
LPSFELTNSYNFQVLGVKKIAGSACDRFRILISDGLYSNSFAMLATQLNPMVHNK